jgi:hypothetical protein
VVEIFISPFFPINYDSNGPGWQLLGELKAKHVSEIFT